MCLETIFGKDVKGNLPKIHRRYANDRNHKLPLNLSQYIHDRSHKLPMNLSQYDHTHIPKCHTNLSQYNWNLDLRTHAQLFMPSVGTQHRWQALATITATERDVKQFPASKVLTNASPGAPGRGEHKHRWALSTPSLSST